MFVQPYPPTGAKYQVPPTGRSPHHPFWTRPEFAFGTPVSVPGGNFGSTNPAFSRNRDVDATGKRLITPVLANEAETESAFAEIRIVLNWFQELKARVPTK